MSLRPLRDRVIVKPLEYKHPVLFVAGIDLRKGVVVAIGPGRRVKRKIPWTIPADTKDPGGAPVMSTGTTFLVEDGPETGEVRPVSVKVGDVVEYGFRDVFEFKGEDGVTYLCIKEQNIYGTTDDSTDSGVLEHRSSPIAI